MRIPALRFNHAQCLSCIWTDKILTKFEGCITTQIARPRPLATWIAYLLKVSVDKRNEFVSGSLNLGEGDIFWFKMCFLCVKPAMVSFLFSFFLFFFFFPSNRDSCRMRLEIKQRICSVDSYAGGQALFWWDCFQGFKQVDSWQKLLS